MDTFRNFIDSSLPDRKGGDILYRFKVKTLNQMNERYKEVSSRGINNEKVLKDLVISEHENIKSDYFNYLREESAKRTAKRRIILNISGSIIYIIALVILFLGISFSTKQWSQTWVIMVDGILLWVSYMLTLGVAVITKKLKRVFHFIARILLGLDVMVLTVACFIFALAVLDLPHSWTIVVGGVAMIFIADLIYALISKQRLVILNSLAYIPSICTMAYIILAAIGILSWGRGWLLIILGLAIDFILIASTLTKNRIEDEEAYEEWNED